MTSVAGVVCHIWRIVTSSIIVPYKYSHLLTYLFPKCHKYCHPQGSPLQAKMCCIFEHFCNIICGKCQTTHAWYSGICVSRVVGQHNRWHMLCECWRHLTVVDQI